MATSTSIPFYKKISCFINLPSEENISNACGSLNLIAYEVVKSNKANYIQITDNMKKIAKMLNIKTEYGQIS